jgi:hypothetical protein
MIRVFKSDGRDYTLITVDGELAAESIEAVEGCCNEVLSAGHRAYLFLRDVSLIDLPGRALLARLSAKGVGLLATGIYTEYVVGGLRGSVTTGEH